MYYDLKIWVIKENLEKSMILELFSEDNFVKIK